MLRIAMLSFAHVHANGYAQRVVDHPEAQIQCIWDDDPARGQIASEQWNAPLYGDLEQVVSSPEVDAVVSIACGIGIQAVAERFGAVPVYPGVNTTSLAIREEPGLWTARCAACGDCVLGETFGLCPVARCAKSLLNGPCGGTREEGKCEVDENTDCVWHLIVKRAEERGELDKLMKVRKAKDWSNSDHGGPKRMVREDLRP